MAKIILPSPKKIYVTSDSHFGHSRLSKLRGYPTSAHMDLHLTECWNKVVPEDGLVLHLGDFALCNPVRARAIADSLNGRIVLIKGNHERTALNKKVIDRFEHVLDYLEIKIQVPMQAPASQHAACVSMLHYPMHVWNKSYWPNSFHLHGHCHGKFRHANPRAMDCGVEVMGPAPVPICELVNLLRSRDLRVDK